MSCEAIFAGAQMCISLGACYCITKRGILGRASARQEAESHAAAESHARQTAETRAQHAEAELEKLRAALERLETTK